MTWLTIQHGTALGCGADSPFQCDRVLATSWSKLFEVPVAALGAACYLAIFMVSWLVGAKSPHVARWGVGLLVPLVTATAGAAVWFIYVQAAMIGGFCLFCMSIHACGLAIAALVAVGLSISCARASEDPRPVIHLQAALTVAPTGPRRVASASAVTGYGQFALPLVIGLLAVGAVIGGQWMFPSQSFEVAEVGDLGADVNLDPNAAEPADGDVTMTDEPGAYVVRRPPTADNGELPAENRADDPLSVDANDEVAATATFDNADSGGNARTGQDEPGDDDPTPVGIDVSDVGALPSRKVSVYGDQIKFDIYKQPYIGEPEAPHVVVELFDYTCQHCRKAHEKLRSAIRRYGDQFVLVAIPVPLEASCNRLITKPRLENRGSCKLSRLALAVASARPSRFARFHYYLMDDKDRTPAYSEALIRSFEEIGKTQMRHQLSKQRELETRVQQNVRLYASLAKRWQGEKAFGLPVLIAGNHITSGGFEFEEDLYEMLEASLDIQPVR